MKSERESSASGGSRSRRSFWILLWPVFGLVGLFFAGQQLYPRLAAAHWKGQLTDASESRVEVILDQIAGLDEAGIAILVEALCSEREVVARGAKQRLAGQIEQWKALPAEKKVLRLQILADALADRVQGFGPSARRDASELTTRILLMRASDQNSVGHSRLLASCGEVLETTSAAGGETSPRPPVPVKPAKQQDQAAFVSAGLDQFDAAKSAVTQVDPLPGGGVPIREEPRQKSETKIEFPVENGEMPPAYFQEPSGMRGLDFSNRAADVMSVPETALPNTRKSEARRDKSPIKSMGHDEVKDAGESESCDLRSVETVELMRRLADAGEDEAGSLQAELTRRGLSAVEIGLAQRLFDADPAVRKKLVGELPGMPGIDAAAWLMECSKDTDAEVRMEAFSLLATSRNPLLVQKIKELAQHDSDARIQQLAERMGGGKRK